MEFRPVYSLRPVYLFAALIVALVSLSTVTAARNDAARFNLIAINADGSSDIADTGLTADDCAAQVATFSNVFCEAN